MTCQLNRGIALETTFSARRALLVMTGIICILSPCHMRAESPPMTMAQVIDYSLLHNAELKMLRDERELFEAESEKAALLPNPAIELDGTSGAFIGAGDNSSLSIGVSQEFLLAGKRAKRRTVADRRRETWQWLLFDRERRLCAEVKTAFYETILTLERSRLAERAVGLNRQLLNMAMGRLATGDIAELDVNLAKVELARSEVSRLETASTLNQSQVKLWTLMGVPAGQSPALAAPLDHEVAMTRSLTDLKQLASANRPDLKALETEKETGDAEIILAKAEGVPNITAGLTVKRDRTSMEIGGITGRESSGSIGLKLSIPIPVFDRNKAGVMEARARRNSTENRMYALGMTIDREVQAAYAGYLDSETVLTLYKTTIMPRSEENLKLIQEAFRLGHTGMATIIQEQKKIFDLNEGWLNALHKRQIALVKLESAVANELTGGAK